MTEAIEQQNEQILEGTLEIPHENTKIFSNMSDLTKYINVFRIENANIRSGILQETGQKVFQLTYQIVNRN